jgi:hypothetical protein
VEGPDSAELLSFEFSSPNGDRCQLVDAYAAVDKGAKADDRQLSQILAGLITPPGALCKDHLGGLDMPAR